MIDYNPKEILISPHIPKCGGISFDKTLHDWFGYGFHKHQAKHVEDIPPRKLSKIKQLLSPFIPAVIHGHFDKESDNIDVFDYYPEANQFITVLRDPVERQMSQYFFTRKIISEGKMIWHGKVHTDINLLGEDVDDCLENHQISFLKFLPWEFTYKNYKQIINENFIHIGITENLQASVDIFAEKLKKKKVKVPMLNAAPKTERPSESAVKKFKEQNKLEYLIYEYALILNS
jgi:hypothetical protein